MISRKLKLCVFTFIPFTCCDRKIGVREAQSDASYYIGKKANVIPYDTLIIDL